MSPAKRPLSCPRLQTTSIAGLRCSLARSQNTTHEKSNDPATIGHLSYFSLQRIPLPHLITGAYYIRLTLVVGNQAPTKDAISSSDCRAISGTIASSLGNPATRIMNARSFLGRCRITSDRFLLHVRACHQVGILSLKIREKNGKSTWKSTLTRSRSALKTRD